MAEFSWFLFIAPWCTLWGVPCEVRVQRGLKLHLNIVWVETGLDLVCGKFNRSRNSNREFLDNDLAVSRGISQRAAKFLDTQYKAKMDHLRELHP